MPSADPVIMDDWSQFIFTSQITLWRSRTRVSSLHIAGSLVDTVWLTISPLVVEVEVEVEVVIVVGWEGEERRIELVE